MIWVWLKGHTLCDPLRSVNALNVAASRRQVNTVGGNNPRSRAKGCIAHARAP